MGLMTVSERGIINRGNEFRQDYSLSKERLWEGILRARQPE